MMAIFVRAIPLALVFLATACGGGTDSKTPSIDGDYVLLTVDGRNPPTAVTPPTALIAEILLSARFEIRGTAVRDIKERRKSNSATVTVDTMLLTLSRIGDRTLLTRASDAPTAVPDTATIADGVVPNALLTLRTRSAPSSSSAVRMTLVYTLQK
jgi:hypothetical protein